MHLIMFSVRDAIFIGSPFVSFLLQKELTSDTLRRDIEALVAILEPVKVAINVVQSDTALLSDFSEACFTVYESLVATTDFPSFLTSRSLGEITDRRVMGPEVFQPIHVSMAPCLDAPSC